ncbi:MAG: hypothetical protein ACFFED_01805 [Candidatus Thorarchaeota archaeon]
MIIPDTIATLLFLLIPILLYLLTAITLRFSDESSSSRWKRWLNAIRQPINLRSLSDEAIQELPETERPIYIKREVMLRLLAIYLVIGVFLLSNLLGTFYHIMGDVLNDVGQGSTGLLRTWSAVVFTTPFSGGWMGTFPWYGYGLWPPSNLAIYHEPWSWVYHTAALAGDPSFFPGMAIDLILIPIVVGVILLLPLARRSVRNAFLPSILHLHISLLVMVSGLFNCFAQAFRLAFLGETLVFGLYEVSASDLNGLPLTMVSSILPILFVIFLLFLGISYKLGKVHYPDSKRSGVLFILNTTVLYWLSLVLTIIV